MLQVRSQVRSYPSTPLYPVDATPEATLPTSLTCSEMRISAANPDDNHASRGIVAKTYTSTWRRDLDNLDDLHFGIQEEMLYARASPAVPGAQVRGFKLCQLEKKKYRAPDSLRSTHEKSQYFLVTSDRSNSAHAHRDARALLQLTTYASASHQDSKGWIQFSGL